MYEFVDFWGWMFEYWLRGDDIAIGSPILLSTMLDELVESIEKGLECSDMVESKNDEEKLDMPQRQHCHDTLFDARLS